MAVSPSARLEADLREAIAHGRYQPGDQLPVTRVLQQHYGVAYQTAYNVIARLRSEGLVTGRRGAGIFVAEAPDIERVERFRTNDVAHLDERIIFRRATREDSVAASVAVGDPVLVVTRTAHGDEHSAGERTVLAADKTELVYHLPVESRA